MGKKQTKNSEDKKIKEKKINVEHKKEKNSRARLGTLVDPEATNSLLRLLGISGWVLFVVGLAVAFRSYMIPTWDKIGWGLLLVGVLLLYVPKLLAVHLVDSEFKFKQIFTFRLLNDKYGKDALELSELLALKEPELLLGVEKGLKKQEKKEKELEKKRKKNAKKKDKGKVQEQKKEDSELEDEKYVEVKKRKKKVFDGTVNEMEGVSDKATKALENGASLQDVLLQYSIPRVYVTKFDGSINADEVKDLRRFVTFVIAVARKHDQVVIKLTSPGGMVAQYGLASSQIARLRTAGIKTTVCVDTVAASGGYMMACVADTICAAPFAYIGSIGVVASLPNLHKWLRKNDVDYLHFTAGQYKTTVTMLNEVTEEQKVKFQLELQSIHDAFINHIARYRPKLDVKSVATGEAWLASEALEKGLVDRLITSDELLTQLTTSHLVILVRRHKDESALWELFGSRSSLLRKSIQTIAQLLSSPFSFLSYLAPKFNLPLSQLTKTLSNQSISSSHPHVDSILSQTHQKSLLADCSIGTPSSLTLPRIHIAAIDPISASMFSRD